MIRLVPSSERPVSPRAPNHSLPGLHTPCVTYILSSAQVADPELQIGFAKGCTGCPFPKDSLAS